MSRLLMLILIAGVIVAVGALVVSTLSPASAKTGGTEVGRPQRNGVQKVSYAVLIAMMFAMAAGALGEG